MTPTAQYQDMTADCELHTSDFLTDDFGMDLGWCYDSHPTPIGNADLSRDAANMDVQRNFYNLNEEADFASANPICTRLPPLSISEYNNRSDILELSAVCPASKHKSSMVDPSSSTESLFGTSGGLFTQRSPLNSGPSQNFLNSSPLEQAESTSATIDTIAVRRSRSTQTSISVSMTADALVGVFPTESEKTRRARYAANQRHSKAREARKDSHHAGSINEAKTLDQELKQRHREKNKVAAAKCRSRQRKQVQTIQEKGSRLGERNLALKVMIQELRRELSSLRSMALDHQQCSCNVAQYNLTQADRIAAEYRLSCFRQQF